MGLVCAKWCRRFFGVGAEAVGWLGLRPNNSSPLRAPPSLPPRRLQLSFNNLSGTIPAGLLTMTRLSGCATPSRFVCTQPRRAAATLSGLTRAAVLARGATHKHMLPGRRSHQRPPWAALRTRAGVGGGGTARWRHGLTSIPIAPFMCGCVALLAPLQHAGPQPQRLDGLASGRIVSTCGPWVRQRAWGTSAYSAPQWRPCGDAPHVRRVPRLRRPAFAASLCARLADGWTQAATASLEHCLVAFPP
jgi:hypothetical protein